MIPFVREYDFEYGRADAVSPGIRRILANNPNPFTFRGTGVYIVGTGEVAVIDPGPADPVHLEALLRALDGERVTAVLTTHTHSDHSPLAQPLAERTGATVYGLPAPAPKAGALRLDEDDEGGFRPHVEIKDGQKISGPGWTLEAVLTPGHASNHVCYAFEEENALFSGDHVMGWSTTVISPPDGDMTAYFESLDKVAARGFATLWPTHGPPIREVGPFLAAYRAHRLERERQVMAAVGAGHARISEIVPVLYADVDPRLHPAAAHSVFAHMLRLVRTGAVTTDDAEPGPASAYRPA